MASSRRWVFTLNNYTEDDEQQLIRFFAEHNVVYLIFGREVAPTTGTRHLQGFLILPSPRRRAFLVRTLFQAHFETARGTSAQAADYCKKEGDHVELGTLPTEQGRRKDIEVIIEWIDEFIADHGRAPSDREIAHGQPRAFLIYRNIGELARLRAPPPILREGEAKEWQDELAQLLDDPADDRSVSFYLDVAGGAGKTWFQQWYFTKHPEKVQLLGVGKRDDMAYAVDASKSVFFVNVPRGGMEFLQYTILEQLKDRMVFSTKYQSSMKTLSVTPHVVVFCNEMPDMNKMSADRYIIKVLG